MAMTILLKRAYEPPADDDGKRILVERLWPRGIKKDALRIDWWPKEIAPTPALRTWFGHDPAKWRAFRERYVEELDANAEQVESLLRAVRAEGTVTFVFAAKDTTHNNAVALRDYLLARGA